MVCKRQVDMIFTKKNQTAPNLNSRIYTQYILKIYSIYQFNIHSGGEGGNFNFKTVVFYV